MQTAMARFFSTTIYSTKNQQCLLNKCAYTRKIGNFLERSLKKLADNTHTQTHRGNEKTLGLPRAISLPLRESPSIPRKQAGCDGESSLLSLRREAPVKLLALSLFSAQKKRQYPPSHSQPVHILIYTCAQTEYVQFTLSLSVHEIQAYT